MMDDIKFRERKLVCFFFSNKHSLSLGIISIQSHKTEFYLIKKLIQLMCAEEVDNLFS